MDDGKITTFDTGIFFQFIHSGNQFENSSKITVDATVFEDSEKIVYEIFDFEKLEGEEQLYNKQYGGRWKRFEMDVESGKIEARDLHRLPDGGNVELPSFNKKYDGVKENCFTYLIEYFGK